MCLFQLTHLLNRLVALFFFFYCFMFSEKKNRINSLANEKIETTNQKEVEVKGPPTTTPKQPIENNTDDNSTPSWRRPNGRQTKVETPIKNSVSFSKFILFLNISSFFIYFVCRKQKQHEYEQRQRGDVEANC